MSTASNNTKAPFEEIYENVRTTEEQGKVLLGIESLLETMYRSSKDGLNTVIQKEIPPPVVASLTEALHHESRAHDTSKIKTYLEGLREAVRAMRVLSLEMAFSPTEETIAVLVGWVRKNIGADVLLELAVDRTLLAGSRLAFHGLYREINLASMVETIIRQKEETIHSLLHE